MKKKLLVLLSLVTVVGLAACSKESSKTKKENMIYDVELSSEEENILDLVGIDKEIDIYEFSVNEEFKQLGIWLEVYKEGELLSRANEFSTPIEPGKHRIAVRVEGEQQESWSIKHKGQGSTSGISFELDEELKNNINSFGTNGNLDEPIELSGDKEIVLKKYVFSDGGNFNSYNNQYYAENPSIIKDYPYVYLLKCKIIEEEL